ncbi:hypothetical protein SAMN06298210_11089 [Prevotellaceae bacterium KH2P17]|jgi:hypothetical protein|nr:hypothetical protein SAMN06298210_11089 [Prevotellaceae bacterium KH2P17]
MVLLFSFAIVAIMIAEAVNVNGKMNVENK